jgi:large subunit ribosomal protein L30
MVTEVKKSKTPVSRRSPSGGRLRITYTTSAIGVKEDQKETVRRLGLSHLGQTVEQMDTPAIRGMIHKVRHLVTVETPSPDPSASLPPALGETGWSDEARDPRQGMEVEDPRQGKVDGGTSSLEG